MSNVGYFRPTHRKGRISRFHSCGLSSSPSVMDRRQKSSATSLTIPPCGRVEDIDASPDVVQLPERLLGLVLTGIRTQFEHDRRLGHILLRERCQDTLDVLARIAASMRAINSSGRAATSSSSSSVSPPSCPCSSIIERSPSPESCDRNQLRSRTNATR